MYITQKYLLDIEKVLTDSIIMQVVGPIPKVEKAKQNRIHNFCCKLHFICAHFSFLWFIFIIISRFSNNMELRGWSRQREDDIKRSYFRQVSLGIHSPVQYVTLHTLRNRQNTINVKTPTPRLLQLLGLTEYRTTTHQELNVRWTSNLQL